MTSMARRRSMPVFVATLLIMVAARSISAGPTNSYYSGSFFYSSDGNMAANRLSFQGPKTVRDAQKANDGSLSIDFWAGACSETGKKGRSTPWWTVDLQESKDVGYVIAIPPGEESEIDIDEYESIEVRVGDTRPSRKGDQNSLCDKVVPDDGQFEEMEEEMGYKKAVYDCKGLTGRYVTVRLPKPRSKLSLCEVMVFPPGKKAENIVEPVMLPDGNCPSGVAGACSMYESQGMTKTDAAIKAFMEGPINCNGNGFFCRVKADAAGANGGVTGTPGDELYPNLNFGYCTDLSTDTSGEWNTDEFGPTGRFDPKHDDGHCHGSNFESSYAALLHDHYYRPYRGTVECCCSMEPSWQEDDEEERWVPVKNYIGRCDYRGEDANDADFNFEDGCSFDKGSGFMAEDAYPEGQCWTMKHFGRPQYPSVLQKPNYPQPSATLSNCQADGDKASTCIIQINAREAKDSLILLSPYPLMPARTISSIEECQYVGGVEIAEQGLRIYEISNLDKIVTSAGGEKVEFQLGYDGCYQDHKKKKAFLNVEYDVTMEQCVNLVASNGYSQFALQNSYMENGKIFIDCWYGLKVDLGSRRYKKIDDNQCMGEDGPSTMSGISYPYNGNWLANGVYTIKNDLNDLNVSFHVGPLPPGETVHYQIFDKYTCALSAPGSAVTPPSS